jgi:hypothetical protein
MEHDPEDPVDLDGPGDAENLQIGASLNLDDKTEQENETD